MKKLILVTLLLLVVLLSGCSDKSYQSGYKIQTAEGAQSRAAYYSLNYSYSKSSGAITMTEWWYDNGRGVIRRLEHHTGTLVISGTYSIEPIVLTNLPGLGK